MTKLLLLQLLLTFVVTVFGIPKNSHRIPAGCSLPDCAYTANWTKGSDGITFIIDAKQPDQTWTGIGFSKEKNMKHMDVVYSGFRGRKFINGHGIWKNKTKVATLPSLSLELSQSNGRLVFKFTHPFRSGSDKKDFSFTDKDCYYLRFFVNNGKIQDDKGKISFGASKEIYSEKPMCVKDLKTEGPPFPPHPGDIPIFQLEGEVKYPENCEDKSCINVLKWKLDISRQVLQYHLVAKQDQNTYTGFGSSSEKNKGPIDAIIAFKRSGKTVVKIVKFPSGSLTPKPSDDRNLKLLKTKLEYKNGRYTFDLEISLKMQGSPHGGDRRRFGDHTNGPYVVFFSGGGELKRDNTPGKLKKKPQYVEFFKPGFAGVTPPGDEPLDPCELKETGEKLAVPGQENCHKYIECTDHTSTDQTCEDELYFNPETQTCGTEDDLAPERKDECGL